MECGVHGPLGQLVAKRVDTVPERENDCAIIQNPLTMAHRVWVLIIKSGDVMRTILAQVRYSIVYFSTTFNSVVTKLSENSFLTQLLLFLGLNSGIGWVFHLLFCYTICQRVLRASIKTLPIQHLKQSSSQLSGLQPSIESLLLIITNANNYSDLLLRLLRSIILRGTRARRRKHVQAGNDYFKFVFDKPILERSKTRRKQPRITFGINWKPGRN